MKYGIYNIRKSSDLLKWMPLFFPVTPFKTIENANVNGPPFYPRLSYVQLYVGNLSTSETKKT